MDDSRADKRLRVLYLFNGSRDGLVEKVRAGENPGDGFWGMVRLPHYDIDADYVELESVYPGWIARFLRRHLNIYFVHLPVLWRIFSYDIVFTSSAFGTQLVFTLLGYIGMRTPRWVMHDFSITGLIGGRRTIRQKLMHWMTSRAAGIVTLGIAEKERLEQRFPHLVGKIAYITFGADPEFFKPGEQDKERRVFSAGFDPDRDWQTLIEACQGLDVPLVLATRLARLERFMPLPPFVTHRQFTPRDLAATYASSQVAVLPLDTSTGLNDTMGCSTLFETMMSGCAIVATDTHTMRSYITDGDNGLLVPEGDAGAMRAAIERLLDDAHLRARLSANARAYALKHLDSEKLAGQLAEYFKRLAVQK